MHRRRTSYVSGDALYCSGMEFCHVPEHQNPLQLRTTGADESEAAGYVGLGFDAAVAPSVSLFGDAELLAGDDAQGVSGVFGLKAQF